jgi:hypothetical protein
MIFLGRKHLASAKLLVERGGDLFVKNNKGVHAIDIGTSIEDEGVQLSAQVLRHAEDLRWSAIKELLLLSNACQSPTRG